MFRNKKIFFLLPILLLFFNLSKAQIVTSKKVAIQKGIYQKPTEIKKEEIAVDKNIKKVVVNDVKIVAPEIKPQKPIVTESKSKKVVINDKDDDDLVLTPSQNYFANQLINNAMSFVGVKYHGGGSTRSGMDCSGMITAVFNIFDLKIPRNSSQMAKVGEKRSKEDVQKGDLIFFRTRGGRNINHVGMVVEVLGDEIKFVHSATSKGVTVSSTKEPYYKKAFVQANKVL